MGMTRLRFLSMLSSGFALAATGPARLLATASSQTVTFSAGFFLPYKGTTFTVHTGSGQVGMVLDDVTSGPTDQRTNQFSLVFSAPKTTKVAEGTYSVSHTGLSSFNLHVAPAGVRSDGKKLYRADFNILL
jgi:hypothetical protein